MNLIDLHCDTASEMLYRNKSLMKNDLSVDINKLKKGDKVTIYYTAKNK